MTYVVAGLLVVIFVLGYLISKYKSEWARRTYRRIEFWRRALGAVILVILAVTFIQSGNPILIALTGLLVLLAALYVAVEEPHKTLV